MLAPATDADAYTLAAEPVAAGLLIVSADADGRETCTLTPEGAQVGRLLAMDRESGESVMDVLLGGTEARPEERKEVRPVASWTTGLVG